MIRPKLGKPAIMLVAGEASGDHHGAALIGELKRQAPRARLFGLGGAEMARAGMDLRLDLAEKSVIGFVEVLKHLWFFRKAFYLAVSLLERERPDVLVLIDYPGFNLRLAEHAKRLNIKVCYYVSPQVWAWKSSRVPKMARLLDKMLVTFPFEKAIYDRVGLDCAFVGNPLVDLVKPSASKLAWRRTHGITRGKKLIGLLPGSREQEVRGLLPVLAAAAGRMARSRPDLSFVVIKAPQLPLAIYTQALREGKGPAIEIFEGKDSGQAYAARAACDFAFVASGTATLETAILKVPFVILYRVNALTYFIGKRLVKIHSIGLANVVAGRRVVPEFLQMLDPKALADEALGFLANPARGQAQIRDLAPGIKGLGSPGVAKRAAKEVLELL